MTQNKNHEYNTGAVRSADCKNVRYDLISPIGLKALAETYAEGAEKFGACNWENGMPATDMLNHALAHIYKFLGGDRSEEHLAHAAWNLLGHPLFRAVARTQRAVAARPKLHAAASGPKAS